MSSGTEEARKAKQRKYIELSKTEVELQVRDLRHAGTKEVLNFCVAELSKGTSWSELRRKLGCGPAHVDRRWRKIRELLIDPIVPKDEEEAMVAQISQTEMILAKIEELSDYIEERTLHSKGHKNEDKFLKVQLDALKLQAERAEKRFEHYMELKKLQKDEKKRQGPSLIFQNNYYVPRPGDPEERIVMPIENSGKEIRQTAELARALNDADDNQE